LLENLGSKKIVPPNVERLRECSKIKERCFRKGLKF